MFVVVISQGCGEGEGEGEGDKVLLGSVEGEGEDKDEGEGEVGTRWGQGQDEGWHNAHNCVHCVIPRHCHCHHWSHCRRFRVVIRAGTFLSLCRC
jgi:hypothetical protein